MGSSPKTKTDQWKPPSDAIAVRQNLSNFLIQLIGQSSQGQTPMFGNLFPTEHGRSVLDEALSTGLPADATPLVAQARGNFENEIAPAVKETLGAKYGIRFGTPVAESLSRAGRDVTTNLNAELARLGDQAQARRLGAAQFTQGGAAGGMNSILNTIVGGTGALTGPGTNTSSTSGGGTDYAQIAAALASVIATFGCWIAEAIYGKHAPETHKLRWYLNVRFGRTWYGRPVMAAYRRWGRRVAASRLAVRLLKPVFAFALRRARVA